MLDVIEEIDKRILEEFGLELIDKYQLFMDEKEKEYYRENIGKIETDFLGFGNCYAMALKYIEENLEQNLDIVDLGCAWGLFSYMFRDYNYIGLDECCNTFFKYHNNCKYIRGSFPDTVPQADVFMAFMSLGYNRNFLLNATNIEFIKKLREAFLNYDFGFTDTEKWVERVIEIDFTKTEIRCGATDRIYFWKKKDDVLSEEEVESKIKDVINEEIENNPFHLEIAKELQRRLS